MATLITYTKRKYDLSYTFAVNPKGEQIKTVFINALDNKNNLIPCAEFILFSNNRTYFAGFDNDDAVGDTSLEIVIDLMKNILEINELITDTYKPKDHCLTENWYRILNEGLLENLIDICSTPAKACEYLKIGIQTLDTILQKEQPQLNSLILLLLEFSYY